MFPGAYFDASFYAPTYFPGVGGVLIVDASTPFDELVRMRADQVLVQVSAEDTVILVRADRLVQPLADDTVIRVREDLEEIEPQK